MTSWLERIYPGREHDPSNRTIFLLYLFLIPFLSVFIVLYGGLFIDSDGVVCRLGAYG